MRIHQLVAASVALALALAACKDKEEKKVAPPPPPAPAPEPPKPLDTADPAAGPPPPSVTAEKKELAEKVLAHMEAIAVAGDSNQADCKKAAGAMKEAMDKARGDIAEMEKMKNDTPDRAAKLWFEKAYSSRMMGVMGKVIGVANKCKADPEFQAAMAESPFAAKNSGAPPAAPTTPAPTTPAPTPSPAPTTP